MIELDGNSLTLETFVDVVRKKHRVTLSDEAKKRVMDSRNIVEKAIERKDVVYGVNTGFGKLSDVRIDDADLHTLQKNLIMSHACGTGEPFGLDVVRGMILLRINALVKGYSGIRLKTVDKLLEMLNEDVVPVVYSQGSLGASGDLVPLAHMVLPLIGEGEVWLEGERLSSREGFEKAGIAPLDSLEAKEGLALINGTQAMVSVGALTLHDAYKTLWHASLASAMSFEALRGITDVFDERIHEARGHSGQRIIASLMGRLLKGSKNTTFQGEERIQDAYSLRCVSQVHGASLEAFSHIKEKVETEMNAATDNPLIFSEDSRAISAGNFHGQVMALPFDYLSIAISELASISERRLERLVNYDLNKRFPPFLANERGRNSGFMIVQYVAASLVSENKSLAHPASVDSIPSSANQEDHVSMGTIAARKASTILTHTRKVVAYEMMCAAQALDFSGKETMNSHLKEVFKQIRKEVPFIKEDTVMQPYMAKMEKLLMGERLDDNDMEVLLWTK